MEIHEAAGNQLAELDPHFLRGQGSRSVRRQKEPRNDVDKEKDKLRRIAHAALVLSITSLLAWFLFFVWQAVN